MLLRNRNSAIPQLQFSLVSATSSSQLENFISAIFGIFLAVESGRGSWKKIEGLKFSDRETPKSVLDKLQNSNLQFNAFYISTDGYKFPIFPASLRKDFDWASVKMSYEPFGTMNTAMIHITAPIGK